MFVLALGALGCEAGAEGGSEGALVEPPFEVKGEVEGLLLGWFDAEGLHTAERRADVPEGRREMVRVQDLRVGPDAQLDPSRVYVADLREAGPDGRYPVRLVSRASFDAEVEGAQRVRGEVVIYGASWCGACRSAAAFLRERGVAFVERDVEREPGAREAMQEAAEAAGVRPSGIPVIDFGGRIIQGFDRGALERAIAASSST